MNRILLYGLLFTAGVLPISAQSLEDLNIQIHGYATQAFLYTTQNNILTTTSSNGSPAWDETVVNVIAQPSPKLRIGVQARYFLMGNLGNTITLDWAAADYKFNEYLGVRFGKVKTPLGLFNEIQDIDPGYMWSLLPQSVYPVEARNASLSHYGGVVYGTLKLGEKLGKLEYRGWGGERTLASTDGYLLAQTEGGLKLPNGMNGITYGAALHWRTPISGLMVGISNFKNNTWSAVIVVSTPFGPLPGTQVLNPFNSQHIFFHYEKNKLMVAAEHTRLPISLSVNISGAGSQPQRIDYQSWYAMASYKLTEKLTAGIYDSQFFDRKALLGPGRYSKDWALSARYDFSQYLYAKAEQHFIDGTAENFDATLNPTGLKPDSKLTVLKIGVSF